MAKLIDIKNFSDSRGNLSVIEKILPFDIKRVFYIYGVNDSIRGLHRHKKTIQAAVAVSGSCSIFNQNGIDDFVEVYNLDNPNKCLIIEPQDYHWMKNFSNDCVLLVFASEYYDADDYIFDSYFEINL